MGKTAVTENGKTCQKWSEQSPHTHSYTSDSQYGLETVAEAANYCRNPTNAHPVAWCYTTDPAVRFEDCAISVCSQ